MKAAHKHAFSLFLALMLIVSVLPMLAAAKEVSSGTCGDNLTWVLDDSGTLTISGSGKMINTDEHGNGVWNYSISDFGWADYRSNQPVTTKRLVLSKGLTTIGRKAFTDSHDLTGQVDIPEGVISIGYAAFFDTKISAVSIPVSMKRIESRVFAYCPLTDVYYAGSQAQWAQIELGEFNDELKAAAIHYAVSDPAPQPSAAPTDPFSITVLVNGAPVQFDVQPRIINNRTMVPLRAIFEALGASVEWDGENRAIYSAKGDTYVTMWVDNPTMVVTRAGKTESKTLDTSPMIMDSRTLVPVRAIAEAYGCEVGWDQASRTVTVTGGAGANDPTLTPTLTPTDGKVLRSTVNESISGCASAYVSGGVLYYNFVMDSSLYVYDGTGVKKYAAGGPPMNIIVVGDSAYYISNGNRAVYVLDLKTGQRDILFSRHKVTRFEFYSGKMYIYAASGEDEQSYIYVLDPSDRKASLLCQWSRDLYGNIGYEFDYNSFYEGNYLILAWSGKKSDIGTLTGQRINLTTGAFNTLFTHETTAPNGLSPTFERCFQHNGYLYFYTHIYINPRGGELSKILYQRYRVDASTGKIQDVTEDQFNQALQASLIAEGLNGAAAEWDYSASRGTLSRTKRGTEISETLMSMSNTAQYILHTNDMLVAVDRKLLPNVTATAVPAAFVSAKLYIMDLDGNSVKEVSNYSGSAGVTSGNSGDSGGNTFEQEPCAVCNGAGTVTCPYCRGTGKGTPVQVLGQTVEQGCTYCGSTGRRLCSGCNGSGVK